MRFLGRIRTVVKTGTYQKMYDYTSGCIRVAQENLDWLVENVAIGMMVEM